MAELTTIGSVEWDVQEIRQSLEEFSEIYDRRPIKDNQGGMKFPHMFALWFISRRLNPDLIVESGIWKGQSTWLFEQACPNAQLFSIDIDLGNREYLSSKAVYSDVDFSDLDWSAIPENSLLFVDDHQNAYKRLQQAFWFGFKHIVFEDNYPTEHGDCYSLKKAFECAGFNPLKVSGVGGYLSSSLAKFKNTLLKFMYKTLSIMPSYNSVAVEKNDLDAKMLRKRLDIYYEFPPIIKPPLTRWGTEWNEINYATPAPLLLDEQDPLYKKHGGEATDYTWICYVKTR